MTHRIIKKKKIMKPEDILALDIIRFGGGGWNGQGGLNGVWANSAEALNTIFSRFNNIAYVTTMQILDYEECPDRSDFPGWNHNGHHEGKARLLWNHFKFNHPEGKLVFSDSPDFWGHWNDKTPVRCIRCGEKRVRDKIYIYGDIGQVSASAFAMTQWNLGVTGLWVSVFHDVHVIIEPLIDIRGLMESPWSNEYYNIACQHAWIHENNFTITTEEYQKRKSYPQLTMF